MKKGCVFFMVFFCLILAFNFVSGEILTSDANVSYDSSIIERFENGSSVKVSVTVKDNSGINIVKGSEDLNEQIRLRENWLLNKTEAVLDSLSEKPNLTAKGVNFFQGNVSIDVFNELLNNSDIEIIKDWTDVPLMQGNLADEIEILVSDAGVQYDSSIIGRFENQSSVTISVKLRDESNIIINGTFEERDVLINQKGDWFNSTITEFLSNFSKEEFNLTGVSTRGFRGNITQKGFNELLKDSRVSLIKDRTDAALITGMLDNETEINQSNELEDQNISSNVKENIAKDNFSFIWISLIIILLILMIITIKFIKNKNEY